jgi:AcrR family transcriptional regulator
VPDVREARRAEIVAQARWLVAEGGLEGLTFGTLERRLPYTRGVITHHFRDKDEIVDAVLDSAVDEIDQATFADAAAEPTHEGRVRAVLASKVHGCLGHREAGEILLALWTRRASDPRADALNARLFARWRKQAHGLFRDRADADLQAALLVGAVLGIVLQAMFDPSVDPEPMIASAAAMFVLR